MTNIAIAGLGDHACRAHLKHLIDMPDVRIMGVFDPSDEAVRKAESEYRVALNRYAEYEDLLADPKVEAVLISSPDGFHLPQMKGAIEAGKHVFCDKPLCHKEEELAALEQVFEAAAAKGLTVTSCHPRRFDPPYIWVKRHLPELTARYGKVLGVHLDFSYHVPDPAKAHLHGDSLLQDHANHELDYVNYLFGVASAELTKLADSQDHYELVGMRADGISFHFIGTRRLEQGIYPEWIRLRFERGELVVNTYDRASSHICDHARITSVHGQKTHLPSDNCIIPVDAGITDYDARFQGLNKAWLDCVGGGANYLRDEEMRANTVVSVGLKNAARLALPAPN